MMFGRAGLVLATVALAAMSFAYSGIFTVYQTEMTLVVRLGKPVQIITEPGLHFITIEQKRL